MRKLYSLPLSILAILFFFANMVGYSQYLVPVAKDDTIRVTFEPRYSTVNALYGEFLNSRVNAPFDSSLYWNYRILSKSVSSPLNLEYNYFTYGLDFHNKNQSFTWEVCNNKATKLCDTAKLVINLINEPIKAGNDFVHVWPGGEVEFNVHDNDRDPEDWSIYLGSNYFMSIIDSPNHGRIDKPVNDYNDYTFLSNKNYIGLDSFKYHICDIFGVCDTATVYIDINNKAPDAANDHYKGQFGKATIDISANDSDYDNNILYSSYKIISTPKKGNASLIFSEFYEDEIHIVYTPFSTFSGIDTITYSVCDSSNACNMANLIIELDANKPPYIDYHGFSSNYYNKGTDKLEIDQWLNDPEGEIDSFSFKVIKAPIHMVVNMDSSGKYTYFFNKPNVFDILVFSVCDKYGACSIGELEFEVGSNIKPELENKHFELNSNQTLKNSIRIDDLNMNFDKRSISILKTTQNAMFNWQLDSTMYYINFDYTPNKNFKKLDTVLIKLCDFDGLCDTSTISFKVTQNEKPIAVDDNFNAQYGKTFTGSVANNDFDIDDNLNPYSYLVVENSTLGNFNLNKNGSFIYSTYIRTSGVDTITYKVCDFYGSCDTANIFIQVNSNNGTYFTHNGYVNVNSSITDCSFANTRLKILEQYSSNKHTQNEINIVTSCIITKGLSIGNDTIYIQSCDSNRCDTIQYIISIRSQFGGRFTNVDSVVFNTPKILQTLIVPNGNIDSALIIRQPSKGNAILVDRFNILYTATDNRKIIDTVVVRVCNDMGICDTTVHSIYIKTARNYPPVAQNITFDANSSTRFSNSLLRLVSDIDNNLDSDSFVLLYNPRGTMVLNQSGYYTYNPIKGVLGHDTIKYRVCDKMGLCDTGQIIIKITQLNAAFIHIRSSSIDNCIGSNISISWDSQSGISPFTYQWEESFDGTTFQSIAWETTERFYPKNTEVGTKFYRCKIEDGRNNGDTSNIVKINIHPNHTITAQAKDVNLTYIKGTTTAEGDAVFSVGAQASFGNLTYIWESSADGIKWIRLVETPSVLGTTNAILTLKKPNIGTKPYYRAIIYTPGWGCSPMTSSAAFLSFTEKVANIPLSIVTQPLNIEQCIGGTTTLQIGVAGGTGVVSYQWQQSADGVNFTSIVGATMPSLVPFSTSIGTSFYRCIIKAGTETVTSNSAKVTVNPSISFTSQPINIKLLYKSGTINADSNAIFKAAVMGGSGMMSYQWQCSSNNSTWSNLTDNTTTLGVKTTALTLVKPKISEVPYFHLVASSTGSGCQAATSATGILTFEARTIANVAPDAVNDNFTTIQAVAINATVATNDTDTEGALNLTSFKAIKNPKNGTLTMSNNGSFNYLPTTTFVGNDTASYSVCDMPGLCDTAFIFFKVTKGNHAPTLVKDAFATKMNAAMKGSVALNDTDFDNNLNKSSYKIITNPKNGNVKMWANGDVLYLPKQNFIGKDTFYYQACDSMGLCSIAEVAVIIKGGFITGKIYYDANNNGIFDAGELGMSNELVLFDTDGKCLSNAAGDFQIAADTSKSYVITPTLNNPLWTVNPLSKTVKTSNNFDQLIENQYFAVRPAIQVSDLAVNVEAGNARPGFTSVTTLTYYNKGTTVLNGKVSLTLDNNVTYESSDVALTQRSGNVLSWSVVNLQPFESRNLMIFTKTNLTAPLGKDVIYAYEGTLASITDTDTTNNKGMAIIAIRGSYDPNDITVDRKEYIRKANDATTPNLPLTYTIRFQNTGNAEAIRVEVLDTIQEKLDFTAFEMVAASHKFEVQVVPDTNKVKRNYTVIKWIFDNINLLDSTSKEACSHGFVKYRFKNISTKTNYMKDSILNKAAIYFDFNPPVLTDTATTKFSTLTVSSLEQYNLEFRAYPNPTNGIVNIELAHEADATIEVFNAVGQAISRQILRGSNGQVEMSGFQTGFYIVKIKTQKGSGSVKIFKN
jgi:large repetitive protein